METSEQTNGYQCVECGDYFIDYDLYSRHVTICKQLHNQRRMLDQRDQYYGAQEEDR